MRILFFILLIFIAAEGCRESREHQEITGKTSPADYKVDSISPNELTDLIKNRNGRALFINVWAVWCEPCVEEFPELVKTAEYYEGKDVDFVTLNVDFTHNINKDVIPFLKKNNAHFAVYNVPEEEGGKIIEILNKSWNGEIPASFIFDKRGKRKIYILGAESSSRFIAGIDSVRSL